MQSVATSSRLVLQRSPLPSSRTLLNGQWNSRRHVSFKNPIEWVREAVGSNVREKSSEQEIAAARKAQIEKGEASVFESIAPIAADKAKVSGAKIVKAKKMHTEHKYSTSHFKISHRKLNLLSRQIAGKPIDSAILQMTFSEKRASKRIKSMLVVAKKHAKKKGLEEKKLIVAESWVTKGPKQIKRLEPRGRGHFGVRIHPDSKMCVVLKEGKTRAELAQQERARKLRRIAAAGYVREDVPLRNPGPAWAW